MIIIFIATLVISFLGSVHPGPLNLSVINNSLNFGKKTAISIILGGILPEIIYSTLAVSGFEMLKKYPYIFEYSRWITAVMLFTMGIFYLLPSKKTRPQPSNLLGFSKGFLLSITNFQLIAFWVFVVIYFDNYTLLKLNSNNKKTAFILGTAFGAFLLNYAYAFFTDKYKVFIFDKISPKMLNWLLIISFWSMAILQIISI